MFFVLPRAWEKEKILSLRDEKNIFLHFFTMLKIFSLAHTRDKTKNIFLLFTR